MKEDTLQFLMNKQRELNALYGKRTYLSWDEVQKWIFNFSIAMMEEITEIWRLCDWKWFQSKRHLPAETYPKLKEEVIDTFFYTLSMFEVLGMDAEDVKAEYMSKWEKNRKRLDHTINGGVQ